MTTRSSLLNISLVLTLILILFGCSGCTATTEGSDSPALSDISDKAQDEEKIFSEQDKNQDVAKEESKEYYLSIRNGTDAHLLANSVANQFREEGYTFENGFIIDCNTAWSKGEALLISETYIIYKEGRPDLELLAEEIQEILGIGIVVEENSDPYGWSYTGDMLVCLGADYANKQ